jgi:uncharacterized membrane protein YhaH (DUF805 family)
MQYHALTEGRAHRTGFWIFTVVFPAMFALFWLTLILLAYGIIRIGQGGWCSLGRVAEDQGRACPKYISSHSAGSA